VVSELGLVLKLGLEVRDRIGYVEVRVRVRVRIRDADNNE
jgi:hypothetical protein